MRGTFLIVMAFVLVGCVSAEEKAQDRAAAQRSAAHQRHLENVADNNRCISYGAQRGTPEYTQCRLQITQMRAQAIEASQAQRAAILGAFLANHRSIQPAPSYQMPTNQGTNCTTSYIGNQTYMHCQ